MKAIIGEIQHFDGFIENIGGMSLGYLHQIYTDDENKTVHQELREAFSQIQKIEQRLKELEEEMIHNHDAIETYTSLLEQLNNI